jgi:CheY-like chemotaxis protein
VPTRLNRRLGTLLDNHGNTPSGAMQSDTSRDEPIAQRWPARREDAWIENCYFENNFVEASRGRRRPDKEYDLTTVAATGRSQGRQSLGRTLATTRIELHGKAAAASAGPGRGSEFHVGLPALPDAGREPSAAPDAEDGTEGTSGRRVLVVDDNPDGADSLAEVLRLLGHDADVAYDPGGAVLKAVSTPFDLVLLDINLPGMDGYEVARRIRDRAPDRAPRFVAMTGFGTEDDHSRSRQEGFIAHLVKPVDFGRLTDLLQSM